jgi:putative two-component system response regulator
MVITGDPARWHEKGVLKKSILFVDDEANFQDSLKRILRRQHSTWDMFYAHSVDEALQQIEEKTFDAIVSDVTMPGKDGFELLRILQGSEKTADIPVIILTGNGEHSLKRRALEMGAADLLSKPINSEDLLARLHNVLRLKAYQDELKKQKEILDQNVKERTAELEESRLDIILRLGKAAEYRDEETGNHIIRVGCYCRAIAEELNMEHEFIEKIFLTSPLHDIGKIGIPDSILLKRGKLTPEEFKVIETHCRIGQEILKQDPKGLKPFLEFHRNHALLQKIHNPILEMASDIALYHHEKWDGSGYPQGIQGTDIPLVARIVTLADVYDALRSTRPYKPSFSEEKTLSILQEEKGSHFDPMVFAAFEKVLDEFRSIHEHFSDQMEPDEIVL